MIAIIPPIKDFFCEILIPGLDFWRIRKDKSKVGRVLKLALSLLIILGLFTFFHNSNVSLVLKHLNSKYKIFQQTPSESKVIITQSAITKDNDENSKGTPKSNAENTANASQLIGQAINDMPSASDEVEETYEYLEYDDAYDESSDFELEYPTDEDPYWEEDHDESSDFELEDPADDTPVEMPANDEQGQTQTSISNTVNSSQNNIITGSGNVISSDITVFQSQDNSTVNTVSNR